MFMACWGSSPVHRSEHPKTRTLTRQRSSPRYDRVRSLVPHPRVLSFRGKSAPFFRN
jgi:hypothetical protein